MARALRVRTLARQIGVPADRLLRWLADHGCAITHEAQFVDATTAQTARAALGAPAPVEDPALPRCAACAAAPLPPGRVARGVEDPARCERCGGSVNRRAAAGLREAFARRGLRRLLVVGGAPGTADELRRLLGGPVQLRLVDGTAHRNEAMARADLAWADVAVIWGSTILAHKVSKLYTDRRADGGGRILVVPRRGVAALCEAVAAQLDGPGG